MSALNKRLEQQILAILEGSNRKQEQGTEAIRFSVEECLRSYIRLLGDVREAEPMRKRFDETSDRLTTALVKLAAGVSDDLKEDQVMVDMGRAMVMMDRARDPSEEITYENLLIMFLRGYLIGATEHDHHL